MVGSDAMPASTKMRTDDAQYDSPLRGALLHTEGPPVAGPRTADDEIVRAEARILLYPRPATGTRSQRQRRRTGRRRQPFARFPAQGRKKGMRRRRAINDEGNAARRR